MTKIDLDAKGGALSRRAVLERAGCALGTAAAVSFGVAPAQAAKMSKGAVAYQNSPKGNQRCDNCTLWQPADACRSVDGVISPQAWCKIYVRKS